MTLKKTDLRGLTGLIRLKRHELGLTQKQLGEKLGIDQRTVSALEKNPASISVARLFAVLEALELQVFTSNLDKSSAQPNGLGGSKPFKKTGFV